MSLRDTIFKIRLAIYRRLPINRKRIVFLSHLGKTYACNPRYLCEYIAAKYPCQYELIWIYDSQASAKPVLPAGVKAIPYFSHKCLRILATSKYVVSNTRISDAFYFKKRIGQIYIQTWHSSMRLKCIEGDANLGESYEEFAKRDSSQIDVIISGCKFSSSIFKKSFWYKGEILESGTPRIDWLKNITPSQIDEIYSKSKLGHDKHYVLYAPTFRRNYNLDAYNVDFKRLCEVLNDKFGGEWNVLYRLHPNLKGVIDTESLPDKVIDMTAYDDIQELLAISDILITDYSSSLFDAALCNKICILYTSDLKEYVASERHLYFDIEALPFPIACNNSQLIDIVNRFDTTSYRRRLTEFLTTVGSFETGTACKRIFEYISAH